ncbi:uncharacterized protein METZ01_LOCUS242808 [marine metagenome]|uniref:Uncharacterized protein n=1 Tax=marine metagenome TaxID=408172 RepID=A0A382HRC8_9ZZZZ
MTFGIIALGLAVGVREELKELKKRLEDSGVLREEAESED